MLNFEEIMSKQYKTQIFVFRIKPSYLSNHPWKSQSFYNLAIDK